MIKGTGFSHALKHFLQDSAIIAANALVSSKLDYCLFKDF